MKPESAACFVAALLVHALLLFGFKLETPARPLPMSEEPSPVDLSLVEAPPEPPPSSAAPTPPEATPTPEPAEPQPSPEMPTPAPTHDQENIPSPEATPAREHPKPAPRRHEQRPSVPHSAAGAAAPLAGRGAARGPLSSHARYLSNPTPDYPELARQQHQTGVVMLSVEVGADGRANDVSVSRTSGFPLLDRAALQAVRRWIFEPARAEGLPVPSHVEVPVRFSLSE